MKKCNCKEKAWRLVCEKCGGEISSCPDCRHYETQLSSLRAELNQENQEQLSFSLIDFSTRVQNLNPEQLKIQALKALQIAVLLAEARGKQNGYILDEWYLPARACLDESLKRNKT